MPRAVAPRRVILLLVLAVLTGLLGMHALSTSHSADAPQASAPDGSMTSAHHESTASAHHGSLTSVHHGSMTSLHHGSLTPAPHESAAPTHHGSLTPAPHGSLGHSQAASPSASSQETTGNRDDALGTPACADCDTAHLAMATCILALLTVLLLVIRPAVWGRPQALLALIARAWPPLLRPSPPSLHALCISRR